MKNKDPNNFYDKNGYVVLKNFFKKNLIRTVFDDLVSNHDEILKLLNNHEKKGLINKKDFAVDNKKIKYLKNAQNYFNSIKFLCSTDLNIIVQELLGKNSYLELIELHQKYPGGSSTPPHQDNFYFCLKKGLSLTAYIPLNSQSYKNGALGVLPKSHKKEFVHHPSDNIGFSSGIDLTDKQKKKIEYYNLKSGDLSLHHCNIIHLAPKNISNKIRVNLAFRFKSINDRIDLNKKKKYQLFLAKSRRI